MTTNNYYEHINDFDGIEPAVNVMPSDVKRLISHCDHTYNDRYYFFSPCEKQFYRYFDKGEYAIKLSCSIVSKKSVKYNFLPDEDFDGSLNIRDTIIVSDRFMKRIENMNKLVLPSMRSKYITN